MKKLLPVIALLFVFAACNNKKKEDKKIEGDTTTTNMTTKADGNAATDPAPTDPTGSRTSGNTSTIDIPTFSDPDVQKFVNDYTEFVRSYKQGIVDPVKAKELANDAMKWNSKMGHYAQKLAANPEDLQKWRTWAEAMKREMQPVK